MKTTAALAVLSAASVALAGDPPTMGVRFTLEEPAYRANFPQGPGPGEDLTIEDLESGLSRELACDLSKQIGFVRFTAAPPEGSPVLSVALVGEPASSPGSLLKATSLVVRVSTGGSLSEEITYPFRDPSDFNLPVSGEAFQAEVRVRFAGLLDDLSADIVQDALNAVALTNTLYLFVNQDPPACVAVLPFRHADLCVLANSGFELQFRRQPFNSLVTRAVRALDPLAALPQAAPDPAFEGGIILEGESLTDLGEVSGILQVEGVFLRQYFPDLARLAARECEVSP